MKKHIQKFFVLILSLSLAVQGGMISAHSGRTDSNGGHHDYKNASGLGSYHYHRGYGPHLHPNGNCPYETSQSSSSQSSSGTSAGRTRKKYQKMLNKLGYYCGKPDGVLGSKSIKAIRRFQKKHNLSVTGRLNKKTKKAIQKTYRLKY